MPIEFRVRAGTLDPVDIPAGPWGYTIDMPWYGDDPAAAAYNREMALESLRKMREYGFTDVQRHPVDRLPGLPGRQARARLPRRRRADEAAKELGFLAVVSYGGGVSGFNAYYQDTAR